MVYAIIILGIIVLIIVDIMVFGRPTQKIKKIIEKRTEKKVRELIKEHYQVMDIELSDINWTKFNLKFYDVYNYDGFHSFNSLYTFHTIKQLKKYLYYKKKEHEHWKFYQTLD